MGNHGNVIRKTRKKDNKSFKKYIVWDTSTDCWQNCESLDIAKKVLLNDDSVKCESFFSDAGLYLPMDTDRDEIYTIEVKAIPYKLELTLGEAK